MRIVSLVSENVKRLSAVEITPDGGMVVIAGRNEAGKSSVLDSIWLALEYAEAAKTNPTPIRTGQDAARVRIDLGEFVVTRTFARADNAAGYTTAIKVTNKDGSTFPKPQTMLDELIGSLSFDPLEFARSKPDAQFDLLKRFVPGVDFAAIATANKADFDRRTEINRLAKEARASAALMQVPENVPAAAPDITALTAKLGTAADHNAKIKERVAKRAQVAIDERRLRERASELAEEAQTLRAKADQMEAQAQELTEKAEAEARRLLAAPALPTEIDTADLLKQIEEARGIEQLMVRVSERAKRVKQAEQLEASAAELTAAIEGRNKAKEAAIAGARMPIEGLGFGDGVVLLNGVPFSQASGEQKITASAAIAMASNPKLRIFCVRNGSDLDEEHMELLSKIVTDNDFQCWIERVDSSGQVGFVIEDGHVKVPTVTLQEHAVPIPEGPGTEAIRPATKPQAPKKAATPKPAAATVEPAAATPPPVSTTVQGDDDL